MLRLWPSNPSDYRWVFIKIDQTNWYYLLFLMMSINLQERGVII
jgi:hypothetical protein